MVIHALLHVWHRIWKGNLLFTVANAAYFERHFFDCTVNSYFRDVFTSQLNNAILDFEPPRTLLRPPPLMGSHQPQTEHLSTPDSTVCGTLDNFPSSVLEDILVYLDAWSLSQTSLVNKTFNKVN